MQCPKCHRPIVDDGGGPYVCCAYASVQWRCVACAKVSDGFAFPYGRCPECGGKLEFADPYRADDPAALEGVRMAFEIELGGRAFYQRAAAESPDAEMRELFGRFALMEGAHMETLSRRYHLDVPDPSVLFRIEVAAIFAEIDSRPQDPDNLFRIAIGLERSAAEFFELRARKSPEHSAERTLFRELAAEEREHGEILEAEHARWLAGKPALFIRDPHAGAADAPADATRRLNAAATLLGTGGDDRIALRCGSEQLTLGQLRECVARTAGAWQARGIGPGDRVAIKLPDGLDWVVAFLGTMWAGAVAVPVNPRVPGPEWNYILDEAGFQVILAESFDDTPQPWRERGLSLDDWRCACAQAEPVAPRVVPEDTPAFWCHSSGTSGRPKAVIHAHRFARRIEQVSREALGIRPGDRLFASSKLFFSYPQTNALFAGLKIGATVIVDAQWPTAAGVAALVAAQRPSVLLSVPSLYRNLLHEGRAPEIAQAGVRLCISAGEALPPSLRDEWRRQTGLEIVNGYGASETLILVMIDRGDGRGFQPSPGVQIHPLEAFAEGSPTRIRIQAPTLALGYLDRPQAQAEHFRDGDFCPADLFAREINAVLPQVDRALTGGGLGSPSPGATMTVGGWRFAGREDSLVKIHGRWVNLVDLEEKLCAGATGIAEAAAVSVPDADGVDAVALFFVASDAGAAGAALQSGASALPPYQRPRWLHAVEALPRGPTGKLLRRKLQELHRTME